MAAGSGQSLKVHVQCTGTPPKDHGVRRPTSETEGIEVWSIIIQLCYL